MAAPAFHLEPSGPPVPCDFPRCILESFHDGLHVFEQPRPQPMGPVFACQACGAKFVIFGGARIERSTCGEQGCIQLLARLEARFTKLDVTCRCPQREYPHELSIHRAVKFESRAVRWPWSLRFAPDME